MNVPMGRYHFITLMEEEEKRKVTVYALVGKRFGATDLSARYLRKCLTEEAYVYAI